MMMTTTAIQLISASISDKGLSEKRPVNEDSFLELPDRNLFAVADGVGGAQAGDVASQMAMEILNEAFSHPQPNIDTEELMEMAIQRANQAIYQMSHDLPQLDMMATTIVTLHVDNNVATIGHVGDSRLYRLDTRGNLFRETQDHSVVEEEVRAGRMTIAQAANHPSRNVISRALGAEDTVEVDMKTIMYEPGSCFLLCSDGVTRHIPDHEIRDILLKNDNPVDACNVIKDLCYGRGAEDNLTAVVVRVGSPESATSLIENYNEPASFDDEDESTIAGIREFSNGDSSIGANTLTDSPQVSEANTAELPALPLSDEITTVPLEQAEVVNYPVSVDSSETVPDEQKSNSDVTLQSKIQNERLKEKIQSAEPVPAYETIEQPKNTGAFGKLLTSLLLLLIGAAIGAGLLFAYFRALGQQNPTVPASTTTTQTSIPPQPQPSPLVVSDLTQNEVTEFRNFERIKRSIDDNPTVSANSVAPTTAADFYLRGRALLQNGNYEEALQALKTAQEMLPDSKNVDAETLRADVAIAQAAVAAMANNYMSSGPKKMLGDLINEKKNNNTALPPNP